MTLAVEKLYTPQDLLDDPKLAGYELVKGHLVERPVSKKSSGVGAEILRLLGTEAKRTREASVYLSDLGYQCFPDSDEVRFPDVSLVRTERESKIEGDPGYMPIPADLAVEVLSPNDRINAIDEKVDEYLEAGFGLVWVVNPHRRHVQIYRPDGSVQLLSEHEEITGEKALPSFKCKVAAFFDV
ncbi:MAG TPA: Uma2 family endonuclease [Tepidisphaeraceae bacterium]|nr:Uma2 family endonuclease [Tepidisphaeraceae bacterium]